MVGLFLFCLSAFNFRGEETVEEHVEQVFAVLAPVENIEQAYISRVLRPILSRNQSEC